MSHSLGAPTGFDLLSEAEKEDVGIRSVLMRKIANKALGTTQDKICRLEPSERRCATAEWQRVWSQIKGMDQQQLRETLALPKAKLCTILGVE